MSRIAIIGLDGLGWNTLLPLLKRDDLKNFSQLLNKSVSGVMKCIPPLTAPSWTSIFTGVRPGKHGIHSFVKTYKEGKEVKRRLYNAYDIQYPRINEMLAMNNMSGLVMNDVFALPSDAQYLRNQTFVCKYGLPPRRLIYPNSLHRLLRYFESSEVEGILSLNEELTPDFLMAIFGKPDVIFHQNPAAVIDPFQEELLCFMSEIDRLLGKLQKEYETIVIVSDHGFDVYLTGINMLGILSERLAYAKKSLISDLFGFVLRRKFTGLLTYSLLVNGIHPMRLRTYITKALTFQKGSKQSNHNGARSIGGHIFYDKGHGASSWSITSVDKKIAKKVYSILKTYDDLFEISYIFNTTDDTYMIRVVPKRKHYLIFEEFLRNVGTPLVNIAVTRHSPDGVFTMYQKRRESRQVIKDISNVDIVPTILALLNFAIPSYTDGRVLLPNIDSVRREDYRMKLQLLRRIRRLKTTRFGAR